MALDGPVFTKADQDYAEGVATVRDWFLADMEAVARSFDLDPLDVLDDVFHIIIGDKVLPRDRAEAVGSCLAIQMKVLHVPGLAH